MSTSTKQTKATKRVSKKEKQEAVVQPVATPAPEQPVAPATKVRKPRVKKEKQEPVAQPVVQEEQVVESTESHEDGDKKQRVRRNVSRDSLEADFLSLEQRIEEEIEKLRQNENGKVKGVKFLRSLNKALKTLHSDCNRVLKVKTKSNRVRSTTSGFMKPVRISTEMASFTGWDASQLYSRVDVTKFICKYIRDNKLQDSNDRRQILCDVRLKALLKYDSATASEPLTYFRLQQYIQKHFVKEDEEVVDVEEDEE